jgi:hypothetical protein
VLKWTSTGNGVASIDDIRTSITKGVGGTAMIPFGHLGDATCADLTDVVAAFRERGARESLAAAGLAGDDLERAVRDRTTSTPAPAFPAWTPTSPADAARGWMAWNVRGCAACHGPDARGGLIDVETGRRRLRTRVPDLTTGTLRRSAAPDALGHRIRFGIPGRRCPRPHARRRTPGVGPWLGGRLPAAPPALVDPVSGKLPAARFEGVPPTSPDDPRFDAAPSTWLPLAPFDAHLHPTPGVDVRARVGDPPSSCASPSRTPRATRNPTALRTASRFAPRPRRSRPSSPSPGRCPSSIAR